jgi:hypothetical protein
METLSFHVILRNSNNQVESIQTKSKGKNNQMSGLLGTLKANLSWMLKKIMFCSTCPELNATLWQVLIAFWIKEGLCSYIKLNS